MTYEKMGGGPLDYFPCHYGKSKLVFRGPKRSLKEDYVAFLGGTETYGKFVAHPFPDLIEAETGIRTVNLGLSNAGADVFYNDVSVLAAASRAKVVVFQITGANNLNNRFYSVHPRRNDRFLKASQLMTTIFRDVDFTEFHFTKHMLGTLARVAPERFSMVIEEVQQAWLSRMQLIFGRLETKVVLLWFADHAVEQKADGEEKIRDPFAIERWMIERLKGRVSSVVEVVASKDAIARGTEGMQFGSMDISAAQGLMGPMAHDEAAVKLIPVLRDLLK